MTHATEPEQPPGKGWRNYTDEDCIAAGGCGGRVTQKQAAMLDVLCCARGDVTVDGFTASTLARLAGIDDVSDVVREFDEIDDSRLSCRPPAGGGRGSPAAVWCYESDDPHATDAEFYGWRLEEAERMGRPDLAEYWRAERDG